MAKYIRNIFNSYFIEQLLVYCYEQLLQLQIIIFGVVLKLTGKEITSFQSKLFLILGTISIVLLGMTSPINYYLKILSLLYKTGKEFNILLEANKKASELTKKYKSHYPNKTDSEIKYFKKESLQRHYMSLKEKELLTNVREVSEDDVPEEIREQIKKKEEAI